MLAKGAPVSCNDRRVVLVARNPMEGGPGVPRSVLQSVPPKQRRILSKLVGLTGGWNTITVCNRGKPGRSNWRSMAEAEDEFNAANNVEFGALDDGSIHLMNGWCKYLDKKGGNCPTNNPWFYDWKKRRLVKDAWRKALRQTLGRGGNRSWRGVDPRVVQALFEAVKMEDAELEPVMPEIWALWQAYDAQAEECRDDHDRRVTEFVEAARRGELLIISTDRFRPAGRPDDDDDPF